MTDEDRQLAAADAMLEAAKDVAGIRLRPFSFGSTRLARKMGLRLFYDRGAELSDEETLDQLAAFLWMQSESNPVEEVLRHVNGGTWEAEVEAFALSIPLHRLPELLRELERVSRLASTLAVEVESRGDSDPDAPGN